MKLSQGSCFNWSFAGWSWHRWHKTMCGNIWRRSIQAARAKEAVCVVLLYLLLGSQSWKLVLNASDPAATSKGVLPGPRLLLSSCICCSSWAYVYCHRYKMHFEAKSSTNFFSGAFLIGRLCNMYKINLPNRNEENVIKKTLRCMWVKSTK